MLVPRPNGPLEVLLPDHDPELGAMSSRHPPAPSFKPVLWPAGLMVVGIALASLGAVDFILDGEAGPLLWVGPLLILGGALWLFLVRRGHPRLLGVYREGFRYLEGARTFVVRWSDVAEASALTEDNQFRIDVTLLGGRVITIPDDVEGLQSVSSLFTRRHTP